MLPFRGFQLVSDEIDNAAVARRVTFPTKTQNFTRAAVIGVGYHAVTPSNGLMNLITRFSIAGRQYMQGDAFPLGLLASGAVPLVAGGSAEQLMRSLFPGQMLPLMDGTFCSGLMLNGREEINIDLESVGAAGTFPIRNIVLYCLEFPRGAYPAGIQSRIDQLWDRFRAGLGQAHFVGNAYTVANAAFQATLEALVNPPHTENARREEIRGLEYNSDDGAAKALNEAGFILATAQVRGQTLTETSNGGVPARQLIGHANLHYWDQVRADFERDTRSLILWTHPAAGADQEVDGRLVTLFEGSDVAGPKLCGPSVF